MVIAFLDLLGFSWLMKYDIKAAFDNLNQFNNIIKTKIIDEKLHPHNKYPKDMQDFAKKTAVTSFRNMISISDSLIIGSDSPDLFLEQLCEFVSYAYIESNKSFRKPFDDIKKVKKTREYNCGKEIMEGVETCAFPLLFRGGISFGDNVIFSPEMQIYNNEAKRNGINVCGIQYLEAVNLESMGKGPRLFCAPAFVNSLSQDSKKCIRPVKNENGELFEIIWTYFAYETLTNSGDKMKNIQGFLNDTLLPAAINLYKYFKQDEKNRQHYIELINLISKGAIIYARDKIKDDIDTINFSRDKLSTVQVFDVNDFID